MPSKFVRGCYPIYLERAWGSCVFDGYGNRYIDYPCGLGAITLGYNYPDVNEAIIRQLQDGAIYTLPSELETILAKQLNKLIPSCEMARFLKTGSEATHAAIKIARAYTNREHIAYCGYHGWHSWYSAATPKNKGVLKREKAVIHKFEYNDLESLETILKEHKVAGVILEPYILEEPKNGFLRKLINLSHKYGALVIFDEVVTGFRTLDFSAQKMFRVRPDLSTFGKGMANGLPISFVCGKTEVMKQLEGDCFVSSTFGGELLSISAALATIKVLKREKAIEHIWNLGSYLRDGFNEMAKHIGIEAKCIGYPNRTFFIFPTETHKSLFWQECIKRGVLFGYAQFITYSHKEGEIFYTLEVIKEALDIVAKYWKNPLKGLRGVPAQETFRLVNTK